MLASKKHPPARDFRPAFTLPGGPIDLSVLDATGSSIPGAPQTKKAARKAMAIMAPELAALQERLYAQGVSGNHERLLVILQGMDTSGKDGVVSHVFSLLNPAGLELTSFKKPTSKELAHDFLWRISRSTPGPGQVGVFNRSQYEDVLVARVHNLVPREEWSKRYAQINAFERRLTRQGTVIVKCFLHITAARQGERLAARLDDPTKYWKFNPADVDERGFWTDYQVAYTEALRRCNTRSAPWFVIPSDKKWFRNWAVARLLLEILREVDPQYPPPTFDVAAEKGALAALARV